jgi:hypothetical protein
MQAIDAVSGLPLAGSIVVVGVEFSETREFRRKFIERMNGVGRADRNASAAIDAIVGIDIELRGVGETTLVLFGMNAVHRASLNAQLVFGAAVRNYVCHIPANCNSAASAVRPFFSDNLLKKSTIGGPADCVIARSHLGEFTRAIHWH